LALRQPVTAGKS